MLSRRRIHDAVLHHRFASIAHRLKHRCVCRRRNAIVVALLDRDQVLVVLLDSVLCDAQVLCSGFGVLPHLDRALRELHLQQRRRRGQRGLRADVLHRAFCLGIGDACFLLGFAQCGLGRSLCFGDALPRRVHTSLCGPRRVDEAHEGVHFLTQRSLHLVPHMVLVPEVPQPCVAPPDLDAPCVPRVAQHEDAMSLEQKPAAARSGADPPDRNLGPIPADDPRYLRVSTDPRGTHALWIVLVTTLMNI
jgi:hypothetical protein